MRNGKVEGPIWPQLNNWKFEGDERTYKLKLEWLKCDEF
jgi:hypothetical protein